MTDARPSAAPNEVPFLQKIAYRVAPRPADEDLRPSKRRVRRRWSPWAIVLVAVGADGQGPLLFGVALLVFRSEIRRRILFYREGIPARDIEILTAYARDHVLDPPMPLDGLLDLFFRYTYKKRIPVVLAEAEATLGRLASDWSATRAGEFHEGGISLIPFDPDRHPPFS